MFFIMAGGFYIASILIRDGTADFRGDSRIDHEVYVDGCSHGGVHPIAGPMAIPNFPTHLDWKRCRLI